MGRAELCTRTQDGALQEARTRGGLRRLLEGARLARPLSSHGRRRLRLRLRQAVAHPAPEWDDFVAGVVADVGAAEKGDTRFAAPIFRDLFFRLTEFRIVRHDIAAA